MGTSLVAAVWILNILVDAAGHMAFKLAAIEPQGLSTLMRWRHMAARPWLWVGIACFIVEFILWLAFLSLVPLAEGVLLGMISIVVLMICGRLFFGEHFTRPRIIGVSLIVAGVALVGAF